MDIGVLSQHIDKIVPERPIEHKGDNALCHFTTQAKSPL